MNHLLSEGRITVRDTELFVDTIGAGTPVLVMHGGLGVDHTYFRPWLDDLAQVAELTFYDHRGNGRSARPPLDRVDHSTWVADADALRARLGHEQVVLLGHSYGGFLALRYALAHPERVRGLVLVSTAAVMDHWDRVHENLTVLGASPGQLRAFEDRPFADDAEVASTFQQLLPLYFHRTEPTVLAQAGASMRFSAAASAAGGRCMGDYDVRDALPSIAAPSLVLAGRHDFIMPADVTAERLAAALPDADWSCSKTAGTSRSSRSTTPSSMLSAGGSRRSTHDHEPQELLGAELDVTSEMQPAIRHRARRCAWTVKRREPHLGTCLCTALARCRSRALRCGDGRGHLRIDRPPRGDVAIHRRAVRGPVGVRMEAPHRLPGLVGAGQRRPPHRLRGGCPRATAS